MAARAKAAAEVVTEPSESTTAAPTRRRTPRTDQPWRANTTRGFVPRARTPRKVGGS